MNRNFRNAAYLTTCCAAAGNRRSAIDGRTTCHPGYATSQMIRKRIEECFGWAKTIGGLRKSRFIGREKLDFQFMLTFAAYNLIRLPKLLAEIDKGHDYVGSIRNMRRDSRWRHWASRAMNWLREKITSIQMTDQGCMFRAYDREIIQAILDSRESQTFIPALAYTFAGNPTEVVVEHEERAAGESKYSLFKLIHLNFDLMTSFSIVPLQIFSLVGMGIAVISVVFVVYLAIRRLTLGPESEGLFTLFAIAFFLIGILLFGIGILGEYVGRIYVQVRQRPRFLIGTVLGPGEQAQENNDA